MSVCGTADCCPTSRASRGRLANREDRTFRPHNFGADPWPVTVGHYVIDSFVAAISAEYLRWANRVANIHSCSQCPAWPNGASNVSPSPVANPSREIEKLWMRTRPMAAPPVVVVAANMRESTKVRAQKAARPMDSGDFRLSVLGPRGSSLEVGVKLWSRVLVLALLNSEHHALIGEASHEYIYISVALA